MSKLLHKGGLIAGEPVVAYCIGVAWLWVSQLLHRGGLVVGEQIIA